MSVLSPAQQLRQKQRERTALLLSVLISAVLVIMMYLVHIKNVDDYDQAFEYGMEVSYGTDAFGSGQETIPIESVTTQQESQPRSENVETSDEVVEKIQTSEGGETRLPSEEEKTPRPSPEENKPRENQTTEKRVQSEEGKESTDSQGNDQDKTGNKGKETGINEEGLYEGGGGSGGSSLSLAGWRWEREPTVNDQSNAVGKIVFDLVVDEEGYFVTVKLRETNIADKSVVEKYRQAVLSSYLEPDNSGRPATLSRGTVTFILKAK